MSPKIQEMIDTLHVNVEDVPFVGKNSGMEYRLLQARPSDSLTAVQYRIAPGYTSALHRHLAPTFGYTTVGIWGHDASYEYRPGTYVYEIPNAPHRFYNGPNVTEAFFLVLGEIEILDPETGEVTARADVARRTDSYFTACEEAGLPRPNVLD